MNIDKALLVIRLQIYFADKPFLFVEIFFTCLNLLRFFKPLSLFHGNNRSYHPLQTLLPILFLCVN